MDVMEVPQAKDAMTVKRVYGEPFENDGVTVIPAASCPRFWRSMSMRGTSGATLSSSPVSSEPGLPPEAEESIR